MNKINQFKRLSIQAYGALLALAAQFRSEDPRSPVGCCVLDKTGRILSTGTNGWKPGMIPDISIHLEENRDKKSSLIIHAENSAISHLKDVSEAHSIYLGFGPCNSCAKLIVSTGIKEVYYLRTHPKYETFREIFDFYGISYQLIKKTDLDDIQNSLQGLLNLVKSL